MVNDAYMVSQPHHSIKTKRRRKRYEWTKEKGGNNETKNKKKEWKNTSHESTTIKRR
jgi:hypothetical protein